MNTLIVWFIVSLVVAAFMFATAKDKSPKVIGSLILSSPILPLLPLLLILEEVFDANQTELLFLTGWIGVLIALIHI